MDPHLTVVILAGGGGTRLWPASRRQHPKQFLPLAPGGRTLLGATVDRVGALAPLDRIMVVTAAAQQSAIAAALPSLPNANIVAEPVARNTAPAIALAAHRLITQNLGHTVMAVLPSDHVVTDEDGFRATVAQAVRLGQKHIVTIGIRPDRPETGYGYLELGQEQDGAARRVERFVEKPSEERAREYLASGKYLWNSGMFFFTADRIWAEVEQHLPDVAKAVRGNYADALSISIDYGIMERTTDIFALPGAFGWNDVGSWASLADVHPATDGNVGVGGPVIAIDASNNVVVGNQAVALVGVDNLVVVTTPDAVLVMPKERAQDVRAIVAELERRGLGRYL